MSLQTVALSEPRMTNITFVGLLSSVDTQVSLQFVRIWTGVAAVRTLRTEVIKKNL